MSVVIAFGPSALSRPVTDGPRSTARIGVVLPVSTRVRPVPSGVTRPVRPLDREKFLVRRPMTSLAA
jgi:hypothetical protein